jgi:hypothetical protein
MGTRRPVALELPGLDPAEAKVRAAAQKVLERRQARAQARAMATRMAIEAEERRTLERLRSEGALGERLRRDERLDALLAARERGKPIGEAMAEAERCPPARANARERPSG